MDLGLLQREVADQLGVCKSEVWRWETGETEPELRFLPKVFEFIGGDPRPEPTGIGARLIRWREQRGWSRRKLAAKLGVDEGTLRQWESGRSCPSRRRSVGVQGLFADAKFGGMKNKPPHIDRDSPLGTSPPIYLSRSDGEPKGSDGARDPSRNHTTWSWFAENERRNPGPGESGTADTRYRVTVSRPRQSVGPVVDSRPTFMLSR
jgi:transcriptional regulator with XRE-family HTH domain